MTPDKRRMHDHGPHAFDRRSRSTAAMFFQLATEETLVPPNLSTTQGEAAERRNQPSSWETPFQL